VAIKRGKGSVADKEAGLAELGWQPEVVVEFLAKPTPRGTAAKLREVEARLSALNRYRQMDSIEPFLPTVTLEKDGVNMRLRLRFDTTPPTSVQMVLSESGFWYSPSEDAWERLLNQKAEANLGLVRSRLAPMYGGEEEPAELNEAEDEYEWPQRMTITIQGISFEVHNHFTVEEWEEGFAETLSHVNQGHRGYRRGGQCFWLNDEGQFVGAQTILHQQVLDKLSALGVLEVTNERRSI
jgi:hypothetical protein